MDKQEQLIEQIKKVLNFLEKDYAKDIENGILQLIYIRYRNALEVLEDNKAI